MLLQSHSAGDRDLWVRTAEVKMNTHMHVSLPFTSSSYPFLLPRFLSCYFPHPFLPFFTQLALKGGNLHFCTSTSSSSRLGMKWFTAWRRGREGRAEEFDTSASFPFTSGLLLLLPWSDLCRLSAFSLTFWWHVDTVMDLRALVIISALLLVTNGKSALFWGKLNTKSKAGLSVRPVCLISL